MIYDKYLILDCRLTRGYDSFKDNPADYVALTPQELTRQNDAFLGLTCKSKIILIGHGASNENDLTSDAKANLPNVQSLTSKRIAEYLKRQLSSTKIEPQKVFDFKAHGANSNHLSMDDYNNGRSDLIRRLTIQLCVCKAAEGHNGFARSFFKDLKLQSLDVNLVAYETIVVSQNGTALLGSSSVDTRKLRRIYPIGKDKSNDDYTREKRNKYKLIFNNENPNGKNYHIEWKAFKLDVLDQLRTEVNQQKWDNKGVGFWGNKTPEGVRLLRDLFRNTTGWTNTGYAPTVHDPLAKDALRIIDRRLESTTSTRNAETLSMYHRYKLALEACV